MSEEVRKMFDGIAKRYDFLNRFMSAGRDWLWRRKSSKMLPKGLKGLHLDLCGGTGDFYSHIKLKNPNLRGVIADFSFQMLYAGQGKEIQAGWVQADALNLPFYNKSFSLVSCAFGFRNLSDPAQGLAEMSRMLEDGGHLLILEFFRPTSFCAKVFYNVLAPIFIPPLGWFFSGKKQAYEYLVKSVKRFMSTKELTEQCVAAGWTVEKIRAFDFSIVHAVLLKKPGSPSSENSQSEHHHHHGHSHG